MSQRSLGLSLQFCQFISSYLFNRLMEGNMYRKSWFFDVFSLKFRVSTCFHWLPVSMFSLQRTRERCGRTPDAEGHHPTGDSDHLGCGDPGDPYYILLGSGPIGPQINDEDIVTIWFGMILNMLQKWTNSVQAKHIQTLISHVYSVLYWSLVQFRIMFQQLMFQHLKPGDCTGPRLKDRAAPLRNAPG